MKIKLISDLHQEFIRQSLDQQFNTQLIATRKNVLKFVKQVFNFQISLGNRTLRFNPTVGIRYKKQFHKKPETISKVDIEKIIEYTHEIENEWASIFFLAYQLGARSGELYALKWADVDWTNKNITISKSYCWKSKLEKEPKNSKDRTLPLNPSVFNYLTDLKQTTSSEYILPHLPAWQKGQAAKILRSIQDTLKIPKTNFHSIRSTFITQLLLNDVPPIKVMALAGHQDFKTTMIYVRSVAKELKGTTDILNFSPMAVKILDTKKSA